MDGAAKHLHIFLKKVSKFDAMKADEFLEWNPELRASLIIYNKVISIILQGVGDRRRLGHRSCGVRCRQPWSDQFSVRSDSRLSLLRRTEIRGNDTQ